jgi:S-formylglutathione hydrolase FrmB
VSTGPRIRADALPDPVTNEPAPFTVLLPSTYESSPSTRFPVLYLLHGAFDDECFWLDYTDVATFADGVIVVMPKENPGGFYIDWADGTEAWERYTFGDAQDGKGGLIGYIDASYRTIPDRAHRAVSGLSMGGFGTMMWAARHPDLFVTAATFSGIVDAEWTDPLGENAFALILGADAAVWGPNGALGQPGTGIVDPYGTVGNPNTDPIDWQDHNPVRLAPNLGNLVGLFIACGDGQPDPNDPRDVNATANPLWYIEVMARSMNDDLVTALGHAEVPFIDRRYSPGTHVTHYWERDLHEWWPTMLAAFGAADPTTFTFRTVLPRGKNSGFPLYTRLEKALSVTVWNWTLGVDSGTPPGFIDVTGASRAGATIGGPGTVHVTTDRYFGPGAAMAVTIGGACQSQKADGTGRLHFDVPALSASSGAPVTFAHGRCPVWPNR